MPTPHPRAHFLPFRRRDLIAFCAGEGRLDATDAERFRTLSRMIAALYHHDFHARLDRIEDGFAPFDPDADTHTIEPVNEADREAGWGVLLQEIDDVLRHANYQAVTDEEVDEALNTRSGIVIDLEVDLAEFQAMRLYWRGQRTDTVEIPRRFRRKGVRATRERRGPRAGRAASPIPGRRLVPGSRARGGQAARSPPVGSTSSSSRTCRAPTSSSSFPTSGRD